MRYKSKTVCVVDNGLFVELAITLAKDFGRVLYFMPWTSGYPNSNILLPGVGLPGIERIDSFWPLLDEIDLFVFPDVYEGPLQEFLEKRMGKRVWGARCGDELELFRADSKKHLEKIGIDIGSWALVKGIGELRKFLEKNDDQWVKISRTRGDFETFHSVNYGLSKPKIDELEHQLGAKGAIMEFIVEEAINDAAEVGYDGYTIDGQYPKTAMFGIEIKDRGLVMKVMPYNSLPEEVRSVNEKLAPTFRDYGYRGFFSSEIRLQKDRIPYVIDPCCRMGAPPNEIMLELVSNWADIIWHGAMGELVEPVFEAKYAAELLLISDWADEHWLPLDFPPALRSRVKLRYATRIGGKYYCVPQACKHPEIGAVVGLGDTMDDAIADVTKIAGKVKGFYLETFPESLDAAQEQIAKLKDFGIKV